MQSNLWCSDTQLKSIVENVSVFSSPMAYVVFIDIILHTMYIIILCMHTVYYSYVWNEFLQEYLLATFVSTFILCQQKAFPIKILFYTVT